MNPRPVTKFKSGNPGKPKGAINKVNKLVKDVVFDTFHELQTSEEAKKKRANFQAWAIDNPRDFYNIASKLINIQVTHEGNPLYPVIFKLDGKFTDSNPNYPGISEESGST